MIHTIKYNDGISLELDFSDKGHTYQVDGQYVPAVTTILNTISKPALIPWAASEGGKWFAENVIVNGEDGTYKFAEDMTVEQMRKGIAGAYKKKSSDAMDIGKLVHKWCEDAINWKLGKGEAPEMPDDESAVKAIEGFRSWMKQNDVEWISAEEKVFNRKYKYAGTVDAVANGNGEFCVIDFKTSARIYDEYFLQCAAYTECIQDIYGKDVEAAWILRFDKKTGAFEAYKSTDHAENFSAFYGALRTYGRMTTLKNSRH